MVLSCVHSSTRRGLKDPTESKRECQAGVWRPDLHCGLTSNWGVTQSEALPLSEPQLPHPQNEGVELNGQGWTQGFLRLVLLVGSCRIRWLQWETWLWIWPRAARGSDPKLATPRPHQPCPHFQGPRHEDVNGWVPTHRCLGRKSSEHMPCRLQVKSRPVTLKALLTPAERREETIYLKPSGGNKYARSNSSLFFEDSGMKVQGRNTTQQPLAFPFWIDNVCQELGNKDSAVRLVFLLLKTCINSDFYLNKND